mmetsp:Transcript_43575/g.136716  ORF Transcript_43575/g.136716 Transcript_43575/m.136716 type:complete len:143 (+) Transcript_43575:602-1030(+)
MKNEIEMLKGVRAELETQVGDLKAANAGLDEQLFQAEASYEKATGELQKEYENRVLRKLDELRKKLRGDFAKEKQELERKRLEDLKVAQARFEQEKETLRDAIDRANNRIYELEQGAPSVWDQIVNWFEENLGSSKTLKDYK